MTLALSASAPFAGVDPILIVTLRGDDPAFEIDIAMHQSPTIQPVQPRDLPLIEAHFARHVPESADEPLPFLPYTPDDDHAPRGFDPDPLARTLGEPKWQRWFAAFVGDRDRIVGHVDLKGSAVRTGLHRCELGIGIERAYRNQGLGGRLMDTAIAFAREASSIDWLDLRVFAHNAPARRLYRRLGFVEIGTQVDCFRVGGHSIDDVLMTLDVAN